MGNVVICSKEEALKKIEHIKEEDFVFLAIINREKYIHYRTKKIKKKKGKELINKADSMIYQDNDFFGVISLYGVMKGKDIINSILFPQLE